MKIAIMQPYFFPYIGYYQYAAASDKFIFYDDVSFIMRGWINRNYIRLNHKKHLVTVPLSKASPNRLISDMQIAKEPNWKTRILRNIKDAYKKSSEFGKIFPIIESIINMDSTFIAELAKQSIRSVFNYLDLEISFVESSAKYENQCLKREIRIIDIARKESSSEVIVPIGGKELYEKEFFKRNEIALFYLKPIIEKYNQNGREFIPSLSIIDVLMFNSKDKCRQMVQKAELI